MKKNESNNYMHEKLWDDITRWICANITGNSVLNVGTFHENKLFEFSRKEISRILAVNLTDEAIEALNEQIDEEIRNSNQLELSSENLMNYKFANWQYDGIILDDVVHEYVDLEGVFDKTSHLLRDDGSLIIAFSYGIEKAVTHRRYYLNNILEGLQKKYTVQSIEFFGEKIGIVSKKSNNINDSSLSLSSLAQVEKLFENINYALDSEIENINKKYQKVLLKYESNKTEGEQIEASYRSLQTKINLQIRDFDNQLIQTNKQWETKYGKLRRQLKEELESKDNIIISLNHEIELKDQLIKEIDSANAVNNNQLKEEHRMEIVELKEKISNYKTKIDIYENTIIKLNEDIEVSRNKSKTLELKLQEKDIEFQDLKEQNNMLYQDILEHIENEKFALKSYKELMKSVESIKKDNSNLQLKYETLKKSKLGSITTAYWRLRKKLFRGVK